MHCFPDKGGKATFVRLLLHVYLLLLWPSVWLIIRLLHGACVAQHLTNYRKIQAMDLKWVRLCTEGYK